MTTLVAAVVGLCGAVPWFAYVLSLPPRIGLGTFGRDTSTLAIGVGAFLIARAVMSAQHKRIDVPKARVRR